jgi:hypothetical protein
MDSRGARATAGSRAIRAAVAGEIEEQTWPTSGYRPGERILNSRGYVFQDFDFLS